jgi:hypothetical protein
MGHRQKGCAAPIRVHQFGNQRHPDGQLTLRRVLTRFKVQRGAGRGTPVRELLVRRSTGCPRDARRPPLTRNLWQAR